MNKGVKIAIGIGITLTAMYVLYYVMKKYNVFGLGIAPSEKNRMTITT